MNHNITTATTPLTPSHALAECKQHHSSSLALAAVFASIGAEEIFSATRVRNLLRAHFNIRRPYAHFREKLDDHALIGSLKKVEKTKIGKDAYMKARLGMTYEQAFGAILSSRKKTENFGAVDVRDLLEEILGTRVSYDGVREKLSDQVEMGAIRPLGFNRYSTDLQDFRGRLPILNRH